MHYLDQFVREPKFDRSRCRHDHLEELRRSENKIYLPVVKGPLFSPQGVKLGWKKKVRSLQALAGRAAGQAFNCGVWEALLFMQHLPCPFPVIKITHKYMELAEHEWASFACTERHHPWLDPFNNRIRRVCRHYRKLYPDVDDDIVD